MDFPTVVTSLRHVSVLLQLWVSCSWLAQTLMQPDVSVFRAHLRKDKKQLHLLPCCFSCLWKKQTCEQQVSPKAALPQVNCCKRSSVFYEWSVAWTNHLLVSGLFPAKPEMYCPKAVIWHFAAASAPSTSLVSQQQRSYCAFFSPYCWEAQNYDNVLTSWAEKSGWKTCKWERKKLFSIAQIVQNYFAATWVVELKEGSSDSEIKVVQAFSCRCCFFHFFPTPIRGNLQ